MRDFVKRGLGETVDSKGNYAIESIFHKPIPKLQHYTTVNRLWDKPEQIYFD